MLRGVGLPMRRHPVGNPLNGCLPSYLTGIKDFYWTWSASLSVACLKGNTLRTSNTISESGSSIRASQRHMRESWKWLLVSDGFIFVVRLFLLFIYFSSDLKSATENTKNAVCMQGLSRFFIHQNITLLSYCVNIKTYFFWFRILANLEWKRF